MGKEERGQDRRKTTANLSRSHQPIDSNHQKEEETIDLVKNQQGGEHGDEEDYYYMPGVSSDSYPTPRHDQHQHQHQMQLPKVPTSTSPAFASSPESLPSQPLPPRHGRGRKKRKLKAVVAEESAVQRSLTQGSQVQPAARAPDYAHKKDEQTQSQEAPETVSGELTEHQAATPIPKRKLLELVLDKLQKKDTYEVFAEPVDPEEVPDYYDFIKIPMDFSTIRKKLTKGVYASLEQFEKDVYLICSNAMDYNAVGTIYYRKARAIQELAKKYFQILRLDPEKLELEHELPSNSKSVFSAKRFTNKATLTKSHFEATGSDFTSGATLATGGNDANLSNTSLHVAMKVRITGCVYSNGTVYQGNNNADGNSSAVDSKAEKSEKFSASAMKAAVVKDGRRALLWEEERRDTFKPWNLLVNGDESILAILGGDSKQLVPIGIQSEYMYIRSLSRFSAGLGPVAWKIAAQKIKRARPSDGTSGLRGSDQTVTSANLSCDKSRPQLNPAHSAPLLIENSKNRVRFNNDVVAQPGRDEGFVQKGTFEGQSDQSTSTMATSTEKSTTNSNAHQPSTNCLSLPNAQSVKFQFDHEPTIELPLEGKKQFQEKSTLTVVESGTKFASEVSQSRLLEIVSRNNKLMQLMLSKQSKEAQPVRSFQVTDSQSVVTDSGISREASGTSKLLRSGGSTDVADTTGITRIHNYQDGYRSVCSPQHASQAISVKDLNCLANLAKNKMHMGSLQTNSNVSVNTPQLSVLSTGSTRSEDDNAIQARVWSQNADLARADANSRSKMQIASGTHFNPQKNDPQIKTSSSVSQFMQQQMFLDISSYIQSQMSQFNSQRPMSAHTISHGHQGQVFESHVSERLATFNSAQSSEENESPQSHLQSLKNLSSQQPLHQTSDISHSLSSDINVECQTSKSPVRQSSRMLVDSQQPNLVLQL